MNNAIQFKQEINKAAQLIKQSKYTVVLTGAGISTPSGIPDFRSPGKGLWTKDDPLEVASLSTFKYNPEKFFNWLLPLAQHIHDAKPNLAHKALADLEKNNQIKAIITQNIDDLHSRAGSKEILPVHGSLELLVCLSCGEKYDISDYWDAYVEQAVLPRCRKCNALLKPNIVLVEELLPMDVWNRAIAHTEKADLIFVIGSSLQVVPACELPKIALSNNAHSIIVNLSKTYLDAYADVAIHHDLNEILPLIAAAVL